MTKQKSALDEVFSSFQNIISHVPSAVANVAGGRQWNEGIPTYGGFSKSSQYVENPNIVSPIQAPDQLTKGLIYKQKLDAMKEANAKLQKPFNSVPKGMNYAESIANKPNSQQLNALAMIKKTVPNLKISDGQIIQLYNKYGDKLLQGLNSTPSDVSQQVKNIQSAIAQSINPRQQPQQQAQQQVQQQNQQGFVFKFENAIKAASKASGLGLDAFHLLRAGENQAENPLAVNQNSNGTVDVGLFQINADPRNVAEVERLKNPAYNAMKAAQIFKSRIQLLKDPVLAIASYNLGAGGAVLNPQEAIKRAAFVYAKAGLQMPQTEFTKDPLGYVRRNMTYYKQLGLFR